MDPKGLFLSFLNPYCMCGPTIEVNIQCLLPVLPAVSPFLGFFLIENEASFKLGTRKKIAFS